jgi:hypothetical protein
MSAHLTRTTVAGALGVFLAAAGPALATPAATSAPAAIDLDTLAVQTVASGANDLEVVINRWLDGEKASTQPVDKSTGDKNKNSANLQLVSLKDAATGQAVAYKCKTVSGIRAWSRARASLVRRGYRRLRVIRFTPRQVKPMANLKGYAKCAGGWYVLTASRGKLRYRIALDGKSFKIEARIKIGVNRRRIVRRKSAPVARKATPVRRPVLETNYRRVNRSVYRHSQPRRWSRHGGFRLGMGRWRRRR